MKSFLQIKHTWTFPYAISINISIAIIIPIIDLINYLALSTWNIWYDMMDTGNYRMNLHQLFPSTPYHIQIEPVWMKSSVIHPKVEWQYFQNRYIIWFCMLLQAVTEMSGHAGWYIWQWKYKPIQLPNYKKYFYQKLFLSVPTVTFLTVEWWEDPSIIWTCLMYWDLPKNKVVTHQTCQ